MSSDCEDGKERTVGITGPAKDTETSVRVISPVDSVSVTNDRDLIENPESLKTMADQEESEGDTVGPVRRINSAAGFNTSENNQEGQQSFDPYRMLERSQSEAVLIHNIEDPSGDVMNLESTQSSEEVGSEGAMASHCNISECSKVYFDLSKAEAYENLCERTPNLLTRTSSGRHLETIPQEDETDECGKFSLSERSISMESTSSEDRSPRGSHISLKSIREDKAFITTGMARKVMKVNKSQEHLSKISKSSWKASFQSYAQNLRQKTKQLQMGSIQEQIHALRELCVMMEQVWAIPTYGRDLAYGLCDIIKSEKLLDIIIKNCQSQSRDLLRSSARLLEKVLTTGNRHKVAEIGLDIVVKMTIEVKGDTEMARVTTGILESLFKTSEDVSSRLIKLGGLEVVLYWCRCNDRLTLRHCAISLANLALYGGPENQEIMAKSKVPEWLFPLAFNDDDSVRYYACLAISVLVANKEIEADVLNSGTLELVLPFINSHIPSEFARMDLSHRHGRSRGWLKRLAGLLSSKREEAQALAAFHFAMEAGIKSDQDKKEVFYEIEAIEPLRKLAGSPNATVSKLAGEALKIIGEELPHKLTQQVPLWSVADVSAWVAQVGFKDLTEDFERCKVDGDLLLTMTKDDLADSIGMTCKITQKRFLRELTHLKMSADYKSCDQTGLDDWLSEMNQEYRQYMYQMMKSGLDKRYLSHVCDDELMNDCGINNGIHRKRIMQRIAAMKELQMYSDQCSLDSADGTLVSRSMDVFISYRRANGSQLASLLKVHLQLRGFSVFLDIEKLRAGKFDEGLLSSVKMAKHFIIVLTPNSLDRCIGDNNQKDWVHKEIVAAINSGCNIIPLMDNFTFPPADMLPEDMRQIVFFNGIRWIHDYQDACVEKLEKFLRGEVNTSSKRAALFQMGSSTEGPVKGPCKYSSSESTSPTSPP